MSSTERTRSISGSGPSIVGATPPPSVMSSSSSAAMCAEFGVTSSASSASDIMLHHHHQQGLLGNDYVIGTMSLLQNFASGIGEQPPAHSSGSGNSSSSAMNISHISSSGELSTTQTTGTTTAAANRSAVSGCGAGISITRNVGANTCRFPKLEECAHFHYERVQLGQILLRLIEDRSDLQSSSNASQNDSTSTATGGLTATTSPAAHTWFIIRVITERSDAFLIRRSLDNLKMLDEMLHRCVYDRKISGLRNLSELDDTDLQVENVVSAYLSRFSTIVTDSLTCGPVLTWFQIDNKGRALPLADMDTMKSINTPAVGAAYGIRKYTAQAVDEISIDVGDMISVIDMPSPAESTWWRGKKYQMHLQKSHYEVGFFPQTCVATIGDKLPRNLVLPAPLVGSLDVSPTKPVLRKHGKLIAFFRSFILSRPSRRRLKQSGIYKERVFSCDLSEHLLNSGQEIPMVLKCCAEFIEEFGIVDGIYRLSGITSNIQKLRRSFDEERIPDFELPEVRQDIHALSSLLKMYFRELPNPLCTYQLYDNFVDAIQTRGDATERLRLMKETVQKLPPPHYRTLKYLAQHLNKISHHHLNTGMTDRNLAIVWAPNLLRSPALESGDDYISGVAALRGVGVQAVVTEYLITNCSLIFDAPEEFDRYDSLQYESLTDTESIQMDQQRDSLDHTMFPERPKSLSVGGTKLISLEEAQTRHNRLEFIDVNKTLAINTPSAPASTYIEVGGGPSSLPDKYHTVLPVPRSWSKRKTHSWKSLFTRNSRPSGAEMKMFPPTGAVTKANKPPTISRPSQLETTSAVVTHFSLKNGHEKLAAAKSIDLFEAKPMDVFVIRSNSIDSLRTVGHSRSVSHDSYFDLLQSPLRTGGNGTCVGMASTASRELSELGLNFDREEPEMRIFSESESLVSSPRVMKDLSRRSTIRSRHDDQHHSSTHPVNHIVNPSPKKQPRLNIPHYSTGQSDWSNDTSTSSSTIALATHQDESMCKRYKLEDQLSDIQFIDCNTPEHCANSTPPSQPPNTIYASVQIHNPPTQDVSSSRSSSVNETSVTSLDTTHQTGSGGRYSYPGMKSNNNSADEDNQMREERFSYPGMGKKFVEPKASYVCRNPVLKNSDRPVVTRAHNKQVGRFSYCDPSSQRGVEILRSNSADIVKKSDLDRSKLSILTLSSPGRSPRYSLLVSGDTSSECSSSINTPVCDMDVSQSGQLLPMTEGSPKSNASPSNRRSFQTKDYEDLPKDLANIKRELSLDLDTSKMSVDGELSMKQTIHLVSTPNTPNCMTETSGNTTSQSVTPSEFGYHHLTTPRQSIAGSPSSPLPSSDVYENLERSFGLYDMNNSSGGLKQIGETAKQGSPIRSTINITYNLKSPSKLKSPTHENVFFTNNNKLQANSSTDYELVSIVTVESRNAEDEAKKPLLETSFDENMVYEQVKFFKGAVSEVNSLLVPQQQEEDVSETERMDDHCAEDVMQQVVPEGKFEATPARESIADSEEVNRNEIIAGSEDSTDVPMYDHELDNIQDSLEMDGHLSMYENVELRRPDKVYANVNLVKITAVSKDPRPSTFNVRQLANKFETSSPVEAQPAFDFSKPFARKVDSNRNSSFTGGQIAKTAAPKSGHILHGTAKITRSLDENAFVREFGNKVDVAKSVQQIGPAVDSVVDGRRMSLEFTKPKTLNQPKRLPEQSPSEMEELCKNQDGSKLKLNLNLTQSTDRYDPIKITPTTENPISLIQHNVNSSSTLHNTKFTAMDEDTSLSSQSSQSKVLGSCKLDRDRIEKIKEERRMQLNEKFRTESFRAAAVNHPPSDYKAKSKSKIELRGDFKDDPVPTVELRVKSKSRNDVRSVLRDSRDGLHQLSGTLGLTLSGTSRIRRISDEKNQNDCVPIVHRNTIDAATFEAEINKTHLSSNRMTTPRKFEQSAVSGDLGRVSLPAMPRISMGSQRGHISPQFSIRDVTAMFESRSQQ